MNPKFTHCYFLFFVFILLTEFDLFAVPVFARKYETSCQTCHVAFPKLTPFGEAFRKNGYRFPVNEEEDARKQEPVLLGQEPHKKVWPGAVWPGDIPRFTPMAVRMSSSEIFSKDKKPKFDMSKNGGFLGFTFASTMGDHLTAWAGASLGVINNVVVPDLERIFLLVKPLDEPYLNFRIGRFEPQLSHATSHRALSLMPWFLSTPVADNQFTLEPSQLGFELSGVNLSGRLEYAAGAVEGSGNQLNDAKDFYGRLGYKLGGMRLDGVGGAKETQPWSEKSVQLASFAYFGSATIGTPTTAMQNDRFRIIGIEQNTIFGDLNFLTVLSNTLNNNPSLLNFTQSSEIWNFYGYSDYVVYPWLIPGIRYDLKKPAKSEREERYQFSIYSLFQANLRIQVITSFLKNKKDGFSFNELEAGFMTAF